VIAGMALSACAKKQTQIDDVPPQKSMKEKESEVTEAEMNEVMSEGTPFDEEFGQVVLKRGARKAQQCVSMNAPTGEGEVTVVFDGEKGRVVDLELSYRYESASAEAQKCIKNAFIGEMIPPFDGNKKVTYTITIEDKTEEKKK
jgi:outer membrane lipoprotein-sorting protein